MSLIRMIGRSFERGADEVAEPVARLETLEDRVLLSAVVENAIEDIVFPNRTEQTIDLFEVFSDTDVYRFTLSDSLGTADDFFDVRLFEDETPLTAANFRQYADQDLWDGTVIHRSVEDFIVQGGGFTVDPVDSTISEITDFDPVTNEPGISNTRGTIAMAKLGGDPNSATNQWFFNLGDNSQNLDNQNGGFTAFGEVLDDGMDVVDAIAALQTEDFTSSNGAFSDTPVRDPDADPLLDDENLVVFSSIDSLLDTFEIVSNSDAGVVTAAIVDGQLQLEFTPGATGTSTIVIRATYIDGSVVEDEFTVQTTRDNAPDLSAAITSNIPAVIETGSTAATAGLISTTFTNTGNAALAAGSSFFASYLLRPSDALDSSSDITIGTGTFVVQPGGLGVGEDWTPAGVNVTVPAGLTLESYDLIVSIDTNDDLEERAEYDNEVVTGEVVTIADAETDLRAIGVTSSLDNQVSYYGQTASASGTATLSVQNLGESLLGTTTVDVRLSLRSVGAEDDSADILLTDTTIDLIDLYTGDSGTFDIDITLPAILPVGAYQLLAEIDPDGNLNEDAGADENNAAITSTVLVSVLEPRDLSIEVDGLSSTAALTAGTAETRQISLTIRNLLASIEGQDVDVQFALRPAGGGTDVQLQQTTFALNDLDTFEQQSFAGINLAFPDDLETGTYSLVATLFVNADDHAVEDFQPANNEFVFGVTLDVDEAVDEPRFTSDIVENTFPTNWVAGNELTGQVTLRLTNNGDLINSGTTITIDFLLRAALLDGPDDNFNTAVLTSHDHTFSADVAEGESVDIVIDVTLPDTVTLIDLNPVADPAAATDPTPYGLIAIVDTGLVVDDDPDLANHEVSGPAIFYYSQALFDVSGLDGRDLGVTVDGVTGLSDGSFIDSSSSNSGAITFTVTNTGLDVLGANYGDVKYQVVLRPVGGGNDVVLVAEGDNAGLDLSALDVGATLQQAVNYTIPAGQVNGPYELLVIVNDDSKQLEGSPVNNTARVAGVTLATVALPEADITDSTLPERVDQTETNAAVTVELSNNGLDIAAGTEVSISIVLRQAGEDDIEIGSSVFNLVGDLVRGTPLTEVVNVTIDAGTTVGTYTVIAVVTIDGVGDPLTVAGDAVRVVAGPNLSGSITDASTPPEYIAEGQASNGQSLTVLLRNDLLDIGAATIDLVVIARPIDAMDDSGDVTLHTEAGIVLDGLAAGSSLAPLVINYDIDDDGPDTLTAGTYRVLVLIDSGDALTEENEADNTLIGPSFTVATGPDLTGDLTLRPGTEAGFDAGAGGIIRVTLDILVGILDVPGGQADVTVTFGLRPELGGAIVDLGSFVVPIAGRAVDSSDPRDFDLTLPADTPEGAYAVVAFIDSDTPAQSDPGDATEDDETNNTAEAYVSVGSPEIVNDIDDVVTSSSTEDHVINLFDVFDQGNDLYRVDLTHAIGGTDFFILQLRTGDAPLTVDAFSAFADSGAYDNSFFQHLIDNDAQTSLLAGGYVLDPASDRIRRVSSSSVIASEASLSNTRGTVTWFGSSLETAIASSMWSINTEDNSEGLDATGATVFGQVIRGGMEVIDAIMGLGTANLGLSNETTFTNTPLREIRESDPVDLPSDLVLFDSVREDITFTFSEAGDDVVDASINADGELVLDFINGAVGTESITVTATDAYGQMVSTTFDVTTSPAPDLTGELTMSSLGEDTRWLAGRTHNLRVSLELTNAGATSVAPSTDPIAVTFALRPVDAVTDFNDVVLKTVFVDVSGLASGGTLDLNNVALQVPGTAGVGRYDVVALIDGGDVVAEADESNNVARRPDANASTGTVEITGPTVDLGIDFGSNLSLDRYDGLTSGDGTRIRVPLEITQLGTGTLTPFSFRQPVGSQVQVSRQVFVQMYARPVGAVDDSQDVLLTVNNGEAVPVTITGLRGGQTRRMMVTALLPAGMDTGDYRLVAVVDANNLVDEANLAGDGEDNNIALSPDGAGDTLTVGTRGFVDLEADIARETLPASVLSSDALRGVVIVSIENTGNVATLRSSRVSLELTAEAPDGTTVVLGTAENVRVGNLRPGIARNINVRVNLPEGLPADYDVASQDWTITATITAFEDIEDEDAANDADDFTMEVVNRRVDLGVEVDTSRLPAEIDAGQTLRVPVTVTNSGTDTVVRGTMASFKVYARPFGAGDNTTDVLLPRAVRLTEETLVNIGNLGADRSKRVMLNVLVPPGVTPADGDNPLASGAYQIVVVVDEAVAPDRGDVEEWDGTPGSTAADALASNSDVGAGSVDITNGTVDLGVSLDRVNLPAALGRFDPIKGTAHVVITNLGDLALPRGQRVDITVVFTPADENSVASDRVVATLENVSVSGLRSGQSLRKVVRIDRPEGMGLDTVWELQATVTPVTTLAEESTENNTSANDQDGEPVRLVVFSPDSANGYIDLAATANGTVNLPNNLTAGSNAVLRLPVTVTNLGMDLATGAKVTLTATAGLIGGGGNPEFVFTLPLTNGSTSQVLNVSRLASGKSKNANMAVRLPAGMPTGNYRIFVTAEIEGEATGAPYADFMPSPATNNKATVVNSATILSDGQTDLDIIFTEGNTSFPQNFSRSAAGDETPMGSLNLFVRNVGTSRLGVNQLVNVKLYAVNVNDLADETELVVLPSASVDGLRPGESVPLEMNIVHLANTLEVDEYRFELELATEPELAEVDNRSRFVVYDSVTVTA
ncbi:peptidylprolyl isomerase [Mucisphaera calidilacus]|uniref:peptidylprolyl isomerase n=1 Tax=Mucisphaera calidilacus TaxID=2527982 RepID=A0A518BW21_9BACT|nr:peptidylprolyl isomerase [Mucisphaera calidilacus]QDU71179.1 Peptidyl-prolyl cis-trans isomerase cyp18 [Mucisphaera calidilacus]